MFDQDILPHLLDILGNNNRRRILELLRRKPCFVTEISERLNINPKAVIEHLAIMQKEGIISSYQDEKRRKYYYLTQNFTISVKISKQETPKTENINTAPPMMNKIVMIQKLLDSRAKLIEHLEGVEKDIDDMINDVIANSRGVFQSSIETEVLLSLVYSPLTPIELADANGRSIPEVTAALRTLASKGYVNSQAGRYRISEEYRAQSREPENIVAHIRCD